MRAMVEMSPESWVRDDIRAAAGYTPGLQANNCTKLNTNECAWPPAPQVMATLNDLVTNQLRLYPDPMAKELCEAAAQRFHVRADQVMAGNGSDDCLTVLFRSHLRPGDRVACPWPTYGLYDTLATIQGVEIEHHDFIRSEHGWALPTELADSDARLILIANPNNPSGTLIPRDELLAFVERAQGIVVIDEAYIDFAADGSSVIDALDTYSNLVVLRTFSKSYSLAGARLGLLFANAQLVTEYKKVKDSYNVNVISQRLGIAALTDRAYHQELIANTLSGREQLEHICHSYGWRWAPSAANFVLADVGPLAPEILRALKERGILVRWWNMPELHHHLRITVGNDQELDALATALADIVPNLQQR